MRAGALDRRIRIEQVTETQGASGEPTSSWAVLEVVAAEARSIGGSESFRGAAVVAEAEVGFLIPWRSDLTTKMRILYDGNTYDILRIAELGRREGLTIQAKARDI